MKNRALAAVLASAAFAASGLVIESGKAQPAPAAPAGGGLTILEFKPAFDDLMTMLIQPRHIKLDPCAVQSLPRRHRAHVGDGAAERPVLASAIVWLTDS